MKKFKQSTGTSSLLNHLKNVHDKCEETEQKPKAQRLERFFGIGASKRSDHKKSVLSRRLALMCARTFIPYHAVCSDGFASFLKAYNIDDKLPHRTTLTRNALKDIYVEMKASVVDVLDQAAPFAMTIDLWTNDFRKRSYITFNYHAIDVNFKMFNVNLATREFGHPHTAIEIAKQLHTVRREFSLTTDFYLVSDKGSFRNLYFEVDICIVI